MADLYSDHEIAIPCPQCGQEITQHVQDLDFVPNVICPACGSSFHLETTDSKSSLDPAENGFDDFKRDE